MTTHIEDQGTLWEVFIQTKKGLPFKHAGSVHGYDEENALQNARDLYTRRSEGALWIVASENIIAAEEEDEDTFYEPAKNKIYRHPTFYEMPEGVKHM